MLRVVKMMKLKRVDYIIALLERIAYQTQGGPFDIRQYLERTVIPNAITEWDTVSSKNDKHGQKDQVGVRPKNQPSNRGQKPNKWRNPFSG